ncbi:MAG TPA: hypothetical protein VI454_09490 [Verrucomicrobiae bacterium]|jgi:tetratricopeptide (TPR) repeat protein
MLCKEEFIKWRTPRASAFVAVAVFTTGLVGCDALDPLLMQPKLPPQGGQQSGASRRPSVSSEAQNERAREQVEAEARRQAQIRTKTDEAIAAEHSGDAADQAGQLYDSLRHYVAALRSWPNPIPAAANIRIREKVIRVAQKTEPRPAIPEEAQRFAIRAETLLKNAASDSEFDKVIMEFQKASNAAPWWDMPYFNLALVLEKTGNPNSAIENFRLYLQANPTAADASQVRRKMVALEVEAELLEPIRRLEGRWASESGSIMELRSSGKSVTMIQIKPSTTAQQNGWHAGDIGFYATFEGSRLKGKMISHHIDPKEVRCWGDRTEHSFTGLVAADGSKITLNAEDSIYNLDTCTLLNKVVRTYSYTRR